MSIFWQTILIASAAALPVLWLLSVVCRIIGYSVRRGWLRAENQSRFETKETENGS